jgi:predicted SprT family Zn-dependent metalloprotease
MNNDTSTTEDRYTLEEAEQLALQLMRDHGVTSLGWQFAWCNSRNIQGQVHFKATRCPYTGRLENVVQKLKLSRNLVRLNNKAAVRDVILHEIAHCLAGVRNGHNSVWKAICMKIGARPEQYIQRSQINVVPEKWVVSCECCNRVVARKHRKPKAGFFDRRMCRHCGSKSIGKFKIIESTPLTTPI